MLRWLVCVVGLSLVAVGGLEAQTILPPRDPSARAPERARTASIRGRVVDGETGIAVVRARVRLVGGLGALNTLALTNESGGFAFTSLPRGSYMLWASKPTYVATRYPDSSAATLRAARQSIELADGQDVEGVTIAIFHGGVIAGRVIDAYGDPADTAMVQAFRVPKNRRERLTLRIGTSTNDIGEFRLSHLEPGRYLIAVTPEHNSFSEVFMPEPNDRARSQAAPTFYPGVQAVEQAQPILLERGKSVAGLAFALVDAPAATVTGVMIDPNGQPVSYGGLVGVRPIVPGSPESGFGEGGRAINGDGTFRLQVPVGEYELEGHSYDRGPNGLASDGREQFGKVHLAVNGDMSGIEIPLGYGATISGHLVFDGASALPTVQSPIWWIQIVSALPGRSDCRTGHATLKPDLSFTVDGAFGTCTVVVNGPFDPWQPRAVIHDGIDLLDETISLGNGDCLQDVQVFLTDKRTEVALQVTDDGGQATRDFVALLFPVDPRKRFDGSRFLQSYVPSRQSENVLSTPPGEYFVVAVDDADPDIFQDADALERLSRVATHVVVAEGDKLTVALRRVKLSNQ